MENKNLKKIKLSIQGMHCGSCAGNVERSVKKVEGVKNASASLMTGKCIIEADNSVSEDELKKAVARAGYKIISIENS